MEEVIINIINFHKLIRNMIINKNKYLMIKDDIFLEFIVNYAEILK